jgi:hypothetical protein
MHEGALALSSVPQLPVQFFISEASYCSFWINSKVSLCALANLFMDKGNCHFILVFGLTKKMNEGPCFWNSVV